jgi:hypothetical protein
MTGQPSRRRRTPPGAGNLLSRGRSPPDRTELAGRLLAGSDEER